MVGPLTVGQLFDTIGRKTMISLTYAPGMTTEGSAEVFPGVNAEGKSLEGVASPLTCPG